MATSNNGAQAAGYGYLPGSNERIMYSSGPNRNYLIVYGPDGNEIGGYLISSGALPTAFSPTLYLDGKPVSWNEDRLGSQGNPLPYGDFLTATSAYATYFLDGGGSGMWFAKQRYYNSSWGRFATSDPFGGSAKGAVPQSWNRYAYTLGDPTNSIDPEGLDSIFCPAEMGSCVNISTPGKYNPYDVFASGVGQVVTGSQLGLMSPDMTDGYNQYAQSMSSGANSVPPEATPP